MRDEADVDARQLLPGDADGAFSFGTGTLYGAGVVAPDGVCENVEAGHSDEECGVVDHGYFPVFAVNLWSQLRGVGVLTDFRIMAFAAFAEDPAEGGDGFVCAVETDALWVVKVLTVKMVCDRALPMAGAADGEGQQEVYAFAEPDSAGCAC